MTLYLPTDEEAAEGIGAWDDTQEQGRPSVRLLDDPDVPALAAFELDREARTNDHYLSTLLEHRNSGSALVNGSVGATSIAQPVNVNRGAW
jgi:hypothetical protein